MRRAQGRERGRRHERQRRDRRQGRDRHRARPATRARYRTARAGGGGDVIVPKADAGTPCVAQRGHIARTLAYYDMENDDVNRREPRHCAKTRVFCTGVEWLQSGSAYPPREGRCEVRGFTEQQCNDVACCYWDSYHRVSTDVGDSVCKDGEIGDECQRDESCSSTAGGSRRTAASWCVSSAEPRSLF